MNHFDNEIKSVITGTLEGHTTSIEFEDVWNKTAVSERKIFGIRKVLAVPLIALIAFLALFTVGFASYTVFRNIDKTDYPFVDDGGVIGKWETVDFVRNIEDFEPGKKLWKGGDFLTSMVFIKGGQMLTALQNGNLAQTTFTWTNGLVISKHEGTASKYIIKEIDGTDYMFFEWKSGDYVFRNMTPSYYVLRKADNDDYSGHQVKRVKEDKVDYPFVDDAAMKGKWESIDLVRSAEEFTPGVKNWLGDISIISFEFEDDGKMKVVTTTPESSRQFTSTWTKGMVLYKNEKVACKCEVKELDGSTYMFYEWKNGDYIFRGMDPFILVLKKVE